MGIIEVAMKCENIKIEKTHLIQVDNGNGLRVLFSALGASIYAIFLDDKLMTLTPYYIKDFYKKSAYYGKTIGPIAGRIKDGLIDIDGTTYQLELNEENKALHGGDNGISNTIFNAKILNSGNGFAIMFSHKRKGSKKGIPGNVTYYVTYSMNNSENKIYVSHRVIVDKAMVLSLTNHAYFTLGETSIHGLKLKIPSSQIVNFDPHDLTPMEQMSIPECMDFRKIAPITKDINNDFLMKSKTKGIDHYFVLDNNEDPLILEGKHVRLEIKTNYQGYQLYTDNYADGIKMKDITCPDYRGVAIEPEDSPLERKTYHKGELYDRHVEYSFIRK